MITESENSESKPYRWEKWSGEYSEDAVFANPRHIIARVYVADNWTAAAYDVAANQCRWRYTWETDFVTDFEILVAEPDSVVEWVRGVLGAYPIGGVPVGSRGLYFSRMIKDNKWYLCPAYIDPIDQRSVYINEMQWNVEYEYEALVIRHPTDLKASECITPFAWCTWNGIQYDNAVKVSERYVVARVGQSFKSYYAELDLKSGKCRVGRDGKIRSYWPDAVEVLVHSKDAIVEWVPHDCKADVPSNAMGYWYSHSSNYVGRIKSETTSNEYVPANIDFLSSNCSYLVDGKIMQGTECEILIIKTQK